LKKVTSVTNRPILFAINMQAEKYPNLLNIL
jgi:hypothetical protein